MTKRNQDRIIGKIEAKGKELNQLNARGKGDTKAADKVRQDLKQLTDDYNAEQD